MAFRFLIAVGLAAQTTCAVVAFAEPAPRDDAVVDRLETAFRRGEVRSVVVTRKIKGGLVVRIANGIDAFLPGSQIDLRPVRTADQIGKTFDVKIIRFRRKKDGGINVVVSRRKILEEERARKKRATRAKLKVGAVLEGTVANLTDYGAFIDLGGGVDGLLHILDITHEPVPHPSKVLRVGEKLRVKIISFQKTDRGPRIGVSRKVLFRRGSDPVIDPRLEKQPAPATVAPAHPKERRGGQIGPQKNPPKPTQSH